MALDYSALQARIADDLNRTDLTTQIQNAILRAIRHYERRKWWFNELRSDTFVTVASQEYYAAAANADIPNLISIDTLRLTVNSTYLDLTQRNFDYIDRIATSTSTTGQPIDFCYYAKQIRLYPIPDAVYTIRIAGSVALTALSSGTDSNAWTSDCEDLIAARASWDVNKNKIRDMESAAAAQVEEQSALQALRATHVSRTSSGMLTAQAF